MLIISIHALREEGDDGLLIRGGLNPISIHALREEGDHRDGYLRRTKLYFYPRPPRGGRLPGIAVGGELTGFLSTPSARRATDHRGPAAHVRQISIHALREEGDSWLPVFWRNRWNFYPRPPRGGRQQPGQRDLSALQFLSTPSARRATRPRWGSPPDKQISIHALREEGDSSPPCSSSSSRQFLSTPSARRATSLPKAVVKDREISIHALREEGDPPTPPSSRSTIYFYPRPPRGGRPISYRPRQA